MSAPLGTATKVYVTHSHAWLRARLFEHADVPPEVDLVSRPEDADLIVYLEPPWSDADAPDTLRKLVPRYVNRICVYSQSDVPIPWAPGMYASLRRRVGPLSRAFSGAFYVQDAREPGGLAEHLDAARRLAPDLLWSFVGSAGNGSLRRRIFEVEDARSLVSDTQRFNDTIRWGWRTTYRDEAQEAFRTYASSLGRSKFVLCPRGVGLSSIRLFEVLEVGRCPVILADGWLPPPFVDWESCAIRIPEGRLDQIPKILRERESDAAALGATARDVWEQFFSPSRRLATLVQGCIEIDSRVGRARRVVTGLGLLGEPTALRRAASSVRRHHR